MADVTVDPQGSIVLLRVTTEAGKAWVNEHIGRENGYQPYWPDVVVEPRYVEEILAGMSSDGLEIATPAGEVIA